MVQIYERAQGLRKMLSKTEKGIKAFNYNIKDMTFL